MIDAICRKCGTRYQLGTDHVCPKSPAKKSASAVKPAPLPRMTDRPGESRKDRAEQAVEPVPLKRGPGRPKSIEDMRAYKAAKAKEYRANKAKP